MNCIDVKPFSYSQEEAPEWYTCGVCSVTNTRLWLEEVSQSEVNLRCAQCAAKIMNPSDANNSNFLKGEGGLIGGFFPAIPMADEHGFWRIGACPIEALDWWVSLKVNVKVPPMSDEAMDERHRCVDVVRVVLGAVCEEFATIEEKHRVQDEQLLTRIVVLLRSIAAGIYLGEKVRYVEEN